MRLQYTSIISSVAQSASIETIDTYESNIDYYEANRYTYIPMPLDGVFFDRERDEIRDISPNQYVFEDETTRGALDVLVEHPFLLIEHNSILSITPKGQFSFSFLDDEGQRVGDIHDAYEEFPSRSDELVELAQDYPVFRIFTLADVNRRLVKQTLYGGVAELESRLAEEINNSELEARDIYEDLSAETIGRWEKSKLTDVNLPISEFMKLSEMLKIVGKRHDLREQFGYESRNQFDQDLGGLIDLRNSIMHATRSLVHSRADLKQLVDRLSRAESVIEAHGGEVQKANYLS